MSTTQGGNPLSVQDNIQVLLKGRNLSREQYFGTKRSIHEENILFEVTE